MPPKKSKKAPTAQAPGDAEGVKVLEDMRAEFFELKQRLESEERQHDLFLRERSKISDFVENARQTIKSKKSEVRLREREISDLEERQWVDLSLNQQKLKETRLSLLNDVFSSERQGLDKRLTKVSQLAQNSDSTYVLNSAKEEARFDETKDEHFIYTLRVKQDEKVMDVRLEYDRKGREVEALYNRRLQEMRKTKDIERRKQLSLIEHRKNEQVQKTMTKQMTEITDLKEFFGSVTSSNLDLLRRIKEEHATLKKRALADAQLTHELKAKNAALTEPLKKAKDDVERLTKQLVGSENVAAEVDDAKSAIRANEKCLAKLLFQQEVLLQQLEAAEHRRDTIKDAFHKGVYDIHQRAALKNLALENKLIILEDYAKADDGEMIDTIKQIKAQKASVTQLTASMVDKFKSALADQGIPMQELGFKLAKPSN